MEYGETMTFARPKCGIWKHTRGPKTNKPKRSGRFPSARRLMYRGRSKAPESVDFTLARPDGRVDLSDVGLRQYIRERAGAMERKLIAARRKAGKRAQGWLNGLRQHYLEAPKTSRVLFQSRLRVIGRDSQRRTALLSRILRFEREYHDARKGHAAGEKPVFPYGTLQLRQRCRVSCATGPP